MYSRTFEHVPDTVDKQVNSESTFELTSSYVYMYSSDISASVQQLTFRVRLVLAFQRNAKSSRNGPGLGFVENSKETRPC